MKHENDVSDMIGCLKVVRIYNFIKETKLYIHASYIFFVVKSENNNLIKIIKHVLHLSTAQVFTDLLLNSPAQTLALVFTRL